MTLTISDEAKRCLQEACFMLRQMFAFLIWHDDVHPTHSQLLRDAVDAYRYHIIRTACLEETLLYLRKLNEFLSTQPKHYRDDLQASDFGYNPKHPLFHKDHIAELHKRVVHPTTRAATHGEGCWHVHKALIVAARAGLDFLAHLSNCIDSEERDLRDIVEFTSDFITRRLVRLKELETQESTQSGG